jgi:hypothetical protein
MMMHSHGFEHRCYLGSMSDFIGIYVDYSMTKLLKWLKC